MSKNLKVFFKSEEKYRRQKWQIKYAQFKKKNTKEISKKVVISKKVLIFRDSR